MDIIRYFDTSITPVNKNNLCRLGDLWKVVPGEEYGDILFPVVHPRLADKFFGFQLAGSGDVRVAVKSPISNLWFFFDDRCQWLATNTPVFMSPKLVRDGISFWTGSIQFMVRLAKEATFRELKFGYSVYQDLIEYVLGVALPNKLSIPVRMNRTAIVNDDGYSVDLPEGFDSTKLSDISFQIFNEYPVSATSIPELQRIQLDKDLPPQSIGQLLFSVVPTVEFSRYLYQISQVPCVVIRELEEGIHHRPMLSDVIQVSDNDYVSTQLIFGADQTIEINCVAAKEGDARKMAVTLSDLISRNGDLYSPPHDLTIGLQLIGSIKQETQDYLKSGILPSFTFKVALKNICY